MSVLVHSVASSICKTENKKKQFLSITIVRSSYILVPKINFCIENGYII